jgi:SAM-dependent methyltransferase
MPNSIDLRDPYWVITLAIRYDESLAGDDDEIFNVPLESGPIYNQKAFAKALQELQEKTAVPRKNGPRKHDASTGDEQRIQAITPVILSGLVAAIQDRTETENGPSAVDLVAYCRRMRRAASTRHQQRKQRRRIQRIVAPFVLSGILVSVVFWSTMSVRNALMDYKILGSEKASSCQANRACRMASTGVWKYADPSNRLVIPDCSLDECKVIEGKLEYPYHTMHTLLKDDIVSLSELEKPSKPRRITWPKRGSSSHLKYPPLRWLGETIVNRLIRETIQEHHSSTTTLSILDCGCGVGGLLYALLDAQHPLAHSLHYHGIALSAPEIYQARQLQAMHKLDTLDVAKRINGDISFQQQDFDFPLAAHRYSVVVAVESLSFSPNLSHTLENLVKSVTKDGLIIIVDDLLCSWVSDERAAELRESLGKPSLNTYEEWDRIIGSFSRIELTQVTDLSLQYDMSEILVDHGVEAQIMSFWVGLRYRIAKQVAEHWNYWFSNYFALSNAAFQIMELARNIAEINFSIHARKQGYQRAELTYCFMILKMK